MAVDETVPTDNPGKHVKTTADTFTETSTTSVDPKQVANSSASTTEEPVTTTSGATRLPVDTSTVTPVTRIQPKSPDSRVRGRNLRQQIRRMHLALIRSDTTML